MSALENGDLANPDGGRMVGHYWLRNPALVPKPDITREIRETIARVKTLAASINSGTIRGAKVVVENLLLIGIGGWRLGRNSFPRHVVLSTINFGFTSLTIQDPDGQHEWMTAFSIWDWVGGRGERDIVSQGRVVHQRISVFWQYGGNR